MNVLFYFILLQHLFYLIAHETRPLLVEEKTANHKVENLFDKTLLLE